MRDLKLVFWLPEGRNSITSTKAYSSGVQGGRLPPCYTACVTQAKPCILLGSGPVFPHLWTSGGHPGPTWGLTSSFHSYLCRRTHLQNKIAAVPNLHSVEIVASLGAFDGQQYMSHTWSRSRALTIDTEARSGKYRRPKKLGYVFGKPPDVSADPTHHTWCSTPLLILDKSLHGINLGPESGLAVKSCI
ncbi:Hypothetical predicted protein [Pelobates cultripes]|uniref:Uncharacterized protein n=1 Tax=Pelobates cultripes TaxID=61616 RepID=A0AAD1TQ47_PELCU|nr:Hypothetical predicted protein [Pelobates cultripes]